MDFSEYTLVSFGDSFTFGQDTVPKHDTSDKDIRPVQIQYKIDCNNLSYTKILADNLGFKDSINFGSMASSNEKQLMLLDSFLRSNSTSKIFVLFNFTHSHRYVQFLKVNNEKKYEIVDITPVTPFKKNYFTGIDSKSIDHNYAIFRNSIQDVYNHVKDRRMLYYMLASYNVPHVTFDILNDIDAHMLRDNPIKYIDSFNKSPNSSDEESLNFLKSYRQELVDKSPFLCHIGIDELEGHTNLTRYLNSKAKCEYGDENYYTEQRWAGGHWSSEGHIEVAKLIEKYINKNHN